MQIRKDKKHESTIFTLFFERVSSDNFKKEERKYIYPPYQNHEKKCASVLMKKKQIQVADYQNIHSAHGIVLNQY